MKLLKPYMYSTTVKNGREWWRRRTAASAVAGMPGTDCLFYTPDGKRL